MRHTISVKEEKNGYLSLQLNGRTVAYGLTQEQLSFYSRGIMVGIEEASDCDINITDSYYSAMQPETSPHGRGCKCNNRT